MIRTAASTRQEIDANSKDPAMMTQQQTGQPTPHAVRFGLLTDLCFALGERGCTSMLIHPSLGEAVLWVPYRRTPRERPRGGAVEARDMGVSARGKQASAAGAGQGAARGRGPPVHGVVAPR